MSYTFIIRTLFLSHEKNIAPTIFCIFLQVILHVILLWGNELREEIQFSIDLDFDVGLYGFINLQYIVCSNVNIHKYTPGFSKYFSPKCSYMTFLLKLGIRGKYLTIYNTLILCQAIKAKSETTQNQNMSRAASI